MKKIIAMVASVTLCIGMLTGCSSFDPVKYVDSSLDYIKTGEITDELLSQADESKEELEKEYQDTIDELVDGLGNQLGVESFKTGDNRTILEDFAKAMLGKMTYEVSEDYKKDGDDYEVQVKIATYDIAKLVQDVAEDCTDKWKKKASSYSNVNDLMEDYYVDCFKQATEKIKSAKSSGSETVTLHITLNDDGLYEVDESELKSMTSKMFNMN